MKELLNKISSYNLFNYLLPGTVFVFILKETSSYDLIQKDLLIGAFLYYFIGLIISRVGSIIIEPLLIKIKFLKFSTYSDFVIYSKEDEKINILSETNNMYRTIVAMMLSLFIIKGLNIIKELTDINKTTQIIIILLLMLSLFLFSYRKQTNYITKRINANKNNNT